MVFGYISKQSRSDSKLHNPPHSHLGTPGGAAQPSVLDVFLGGGG